MNFENEKYLQKAQVEVLGASVEVWADSTAATRIAIFFFWDSNKQNKIAEKKIVQPPFSKGVHLDSKVVSWKSHVIWTTSETTSERHPNPS